MKDKFQLLAVLLIFSIYIKSVSSKIYSPFKTLGGIKKKGLPFPEIALFVAISSQLVGMGSILFYELGFIEKDWIKYGLLYLIGFTFLTIIFYHNPFVDEKQWNNALKNLGLIGGLILLVNYYQ